jgi:thiol-disulfide isomerase/thioredoxin
MIKQYGVLLIVFLTVLISLCGCVDQEPATEPATNNELMTVNSTQDIDLLLQEGPVFIMIGRVTHPVCPPCIETKPIIEQLAVEYSDRIKFIFISTKQRQLVSQFYVASIPAYFMLVKSENNTIIFINKYGKLTSNPSEALMHPSYSGQPVPHLDKELTKKDLEMTIQHALRNID